MVLGAHASVPEDRPAASWRAAVPQPGCCHPLLDQALPEALLDQLAVQVLANEHHLGHLQLIIPIEF